jgi:hypothetical protein
LQSKFRLLPLAKFICEFRRVLEQQRELEHLRTRLKDQQADTDQVAQVSTHASHRPFSFAISCKVLPNSSTSFSNRSASWSAVCRTCSLFENHTALALQSKDSEMADMIRSHGEV